MYRRKLTESRSQSHDDLLMLDEEHEEHLCGGMQHFCQDPDERGDVSQSAALSDDHMWRLPRTYSK